MGCKGSRRLSHPRQLRPLSTFRQRRKCRKLVSAVVLGRGQEQKPLEKRRLEECPSGLRNRF
jgi:hypothetical protein